MSVSIDSRFLSMIVHDVRTPLNVIGLSMRMIEQESSDSGELAEDVQVVQANLQQIDAMLAAMGDYGRQVEREVEDLAFPFDPRRLTAEVFEQVSEGLRAPLAEGAIVEEAGCPPEVRLDEPSVRLALYYALSNAITSAEGAPVRVVLGGRPGRWVTRIRTEAAPAPTVRPAELSSDRFDRLLGNASSRLGLDLAIVALVSERFGGSARLEVEDGIGSTLVLDWPDRARPD